MAGTVSVCPPRTSRGLDRVVSAHDVVADPRTQMRRPSRPQEVDEFLFGEALEATSTSWRVSAKTSVASIGFMRSWLRGAPPSVETVVEEVERSIRLYRSHPDVRRRRIAVELAGAHHHADVGGEAVGQRPRVAIGRRDPQVERPTRHDRRDAEAAELADEPLEARPVGDGLNVDVGVVAPRGDRRCLHGPGDHQAEMFADLGEVADELGVAGVEADSGAREVRPLRQRVHSDDPVEARRENRPAPPT